MKKKNSFREKFRYWFDNQMSHGTSAMIRLLALTTAVMIVIIALAIIGFRLQEKRDLFSAFWDTFAYTVNSYIPNVGDTDSHTLPMYAAAGFIGLLITSALIGVMSAGIESRLDELRRGNSRVLEENHIVVLGLTKGEYTLLNQLTAGCGNEEKTILIADDMDRPEMEQLIHENISVPHNVRMICRSVDITDPGALNICSIPEAQAVVINAVDDHTVIKSVLAVTSLIDTESQHKPVITASVSSGKYHFPAGMCRDYRICMLETYDIIARLIARSCRHPGLSGVFEELFSYSGSEFYLLDAGMYSGKTFSWVMEHMIGGVPVGICDRQCTRLVPDGGQIIRKNDRLIVIEEKEGMAECRENQAGADYHAIVHPSAEKKNRVVIIGVNEVIETVLNELPDDINNVVLASIFSITGEQVSNIQKKHPHLNVTVFDKDIHCIDNLRELVAGSKRIVLLSRHSIDAETSDINNMQILLDLYELRRMYHYRYTITAEMRCEANKNLISEKDHGDFVVASDISAMLLAQMVNQPELHGVFEELLSKDGCELFLKSAGSFGCAGQKLTTGTIRNAALENGYIMIGYRQMNGDNPELSINPDVNKTVELKPSDCLIMMGKYH